MGEGMPKRPRKLKVSISEQAYRDLNSIWNWNESTYGTGQANAYVAFLVSRAQDVQLSELRPIESEPGWYFKVLKRRPRGHGHIAIYRVKDDSVDVLHFFHTAQNWPEKL